MQHEFEDLQKEIDKLWPYRRFIIIGCFIILVIICMFMSFAYGSARICKQVDGQLDAKYICHTNITTEAPNRQPFINELPHLNVSTVSL